MPADQVLVKGASDMYRSTFVDPGAVMGDFAEKSAQHVRDIFARRDAEHKEIQDKAAKYLESIGGDTVNLAKVPKNYRNAVKNYLKKGKQEYAEMAELAAKSDPTSEEYQKATDRMDEISASFTTLSNQFDTFKVYKEDALIDFGDAVNGSISKGVDSKTKNVLVNLATDSMNLNINEIGELEFNDGSETYKLDSLPQYFGVSPTWSDIFDYADELTSKPVEWSQAFEDSLKRKINFSIMQNGGEQAIKSLAADDPLGDGGFLVNPDLIDNPENIEELRSTVLSQVVNSLKSVNKTAYDAKMEAERRKLAARRSTGGGRRGSEGDGLTPTLRAEINALTNLHYNDAQDLASKMMSGVDRSEKEKAWTQFITNATESDPNINSLTKEEMLEKFKLPEGVASKLKDDEKEYFQSIERDIKNDPAQLYMYVGRKGDEDEFSNWKKVKAPIGFNDKQDVLVKALLEIGYSNKAIGHVVGQQPKTETKKSKRGLLDPKQ